MALRVLLADESTTIKKVMQLALQDFAIEVKAVHVGVDVLEVARSFQPDLIFADILLQKKNGYEVCGELKADPTLKDIPVVLMWSSFMEFDEALATKNKANGRLEKPFDVEALRKVVLQLVPKTHTQRLAHYLEYSDKVTEPLRTEASQAQTPAQPTAQVRTPVEPVVQPLVQPLVQPQPAPPARPPEVKANPAPQARPEPRPAPKAAPAPAATPTPPKLSLDLTATLPPDFSTDLPTESAKPAPTIHLDEAPTSTWNMDSFEDIDLEEDAFAPMNLAPKTDSPKTDDGEPWSHQDLSRFKIDLPSVSVAADDIDINIDLGEQEFGMATSVRPRPPETPILTQADDLALDGEVSSPDFAIPDIPVFDEPLEPIQFEVESLPEVELDVAPTPIEPLQLDEPTPEVGSDLLGIEDTTLNIATPGPIPQMDADRLEEIIRAQSRDIIEAVVRRIVPDLAEKLIRAELDRLMGDNNSDEVERPRSP